MFREDTPASFRGKGGRWLRRPARARRRARSRLRVSRRLVTAAPQAELEADDGLSRRSAEREAGCPCPGVPYTLLDPVGDRDGQRPDGAVAGRRPCPSPAGHRLLRLLLIVSRPPSRIHHEVSRRVTGAWQPSRDPARGVAGGRRDPSSHLL